MNHDTFGVESDVRRSSSCIPNEISIQCLNSSADDDSLCCICASAVDLNLNCCFITLMS